MKKTMLAGLVAFSLLIVSACARSSDPSASSPSSSNAPPPDFDIDTGPCLCRSQQDEMTTCCRHAMSLTCQCVSSGSYACNLVPNGRQCGPASKAAGSPPTD